ncbi:ROK family transcriptional regulator [Gryllotalpicola daejeonensis]|uniref:ROK family transcriptional regulator n=1 Tax=Gryllotalpicola daejeonensis TaxID=993087 RepID=A0ABP7ZKW6_9MICO
MSNRSPHADVNRSAVLAQLGAHGPASRADLARALGVSPAHMTQLTRELLADGLVVELEQAPSQGGRPARMLGVAATAGSAVGVKVAADHAAFVEVGIDGGVLRSAAREFDASATTALADLTEILAEFIAGCGSQRLLGVGVGVPGSVDSQASGVVDSVQLGWAQMPLGATLRRALGHPVLIENNVNALSMAERLYGVGRAHEDFVVVTIGTGVGCGIVLGGTVLRGASGGAGEIGHIPAVEDGPLCSCGNHGCLEALISEGALVRTARERGVIDAGDGIAALRDAADGGDAGAFAVFAEAGHRLGRALAGVVHTVDPELVIVMGEGTAAWPHWAAGFEPALRSALIPARRGIGVAVETWQDESWAQGAAALVLATPFDAEGIAGAEGELVRARLREASVN